MIVAKPSDEASSRFRGLKNSFPHPIPLSIYFHAQHFGSDQAIDRSTAGRSPTNATSLPLPLSEVFWGPNYVGPKWKRCLTLGSLYHLQGHTKSEKVCRVLCDLMKCAYRSPQKLNIHLLSWDLPCNHQTLRLMFRSLLITTEALKLATAKRRKTA